MKIKKKIITAYILIVLIISVSVPKVHANSAPRSESIDVTPYILVTACLGIVLLINSEKHNKAKEPVTSVLFDQESVDLKIDRNKLVVDANFEYQNTTEKYLKMDLFFPFSNSIQSSIEDISIILVRPDSRYYGRRNIPLKYNIDNPYQVSFDFKIRPLERIFLKVHYVETLFENNAEYIITTIKRWKRPVTEATFMVQIPSDFNNPTFSFEDRLVEKTHIEDFDIYKFRFLNLYPDKDFLISWSE